MTQSNGNLTMSRPVSTNNLVSLYEDGLRDMAAVLGFYDVPSTITETVNEQANVQTTESEEKEA